MELVCSPSRVRGLRLCAACRAWGQMTDSLGEPLLGEPNDFELPPENCAGANYSEVVKSGVWGWADTACASQYIFMCRTAGRCHGC